MQEFTERVSKLSPRRLALLAVELQARLESLEQSRTPEPVAIIGVGCRFPGGADSPEAFWRLLHEGVDAIREVPNERWNVDAFYDANPDTPGKTSTRWGGFLEGVDQFDAAFFGISPREAAAMDPQQRLLLEVSWEALERAGQAPDKLSGSQTGVFVGISTGDYYQLQLRGGWSGIDGYMASGSAHSVAAGRLSYVLGLQGPSLPIDTACSSSLVAVHLALQSLHNRECRMALVAGVNLILSPETSIALSKAHMMAADGRCKTFDARADGFVRGEGCGVVVLKCLSDALADGNPILALIRGSAINQDGHSNGLTAPNGRAQEAVLRAALANANVDPAQISYVETHGTGTSLGDPIEVRALGTVLCRERTQPLAIGSVKTNVGHMEAASGIGGLIKVVLALQHGEIPPHLHLQQRNPYIPWDEFPAITIPTEPTIWSPEQEMRFAGLSSFGFSGTNAHVILQQSPLMQPIARVQPPAHLYTLSAKSEVALQVLARRHEEYLSHTVEPLADLCFTANTGRAHFNQRIAAVVTSTEQLREKLATTGEADNVAGMWRGHVTSQHKPEIAFLFTGQGAQYSGMGRQLYETQPVFRKCLQHCDELLQPYLPERLLSVLYPQDERAAALLDETAYTQPALFALGYALAELWQSWGIQPAAVLGHSVGELTAACVAGVFSLEDGLRLIAKRGQLMQQLPRGGGMAAVFTNEERVRDVLIPYRGQISVAAINGPSNTVISGPVGPLQSILDKLANEGVTARRLNVSHAFHSPLMDPALSALAAVAATVTHRSPKVGLISNLSGHFVTNTQLADPDYWCRHAREPVRFAASIETLHQNGYSFFLEIGPSPTLLSLGQRCLPEDTGTWLPSLRKGKEDSLQMLESLAKLYVSGTEVDWEHFSENEGGSQRRVILPTYPFQRERFWVPSESPTPPAALLAQSTVKLPSAQDAIDDLLYEIDWQTDGADTVSEARNVPDIASISVQLQARVDTLSKQYEMSQYGRMLPELDALCSAYIVQGLRQLGCELNLGQYLSTDTLLRLGIPERHHRLLNRMLQILGEDGVLQSTSTGWVVSQPPPIVNINPILEALLHRYPALSAEITLTGRCGSQLAHLLRGSIDPLQLLFPGGSLADTGNLYQQSPSSRFYNTLVSEIVSLALSSAGDGRVIRILEIGAGTGGTTAAVLPVLTAQRVEYVFTDVSPMFINKAKDKFARFPFVQYAKLDITRDGQAQGFAQHQYDIILCANVLHATPDLQHTLANVRQLLAPQGLVILLEGTLPQRFGDLTVGLTDGWWAYTDVDLRPDYALMSKDRWMDLLKREGFVDAAALPGEEADRVLLQQAVIMARGPGNAPRDVTETSPGYWLMFQDESGIGQELALSLQARGHRVVSVTSGGAYERLGADHFQLDAACPDDFQRLLRELDVTRSEPCNGVIHLWSVDVHMQEQDGLSTLEQSQIRVSGSALHLAQALVSAGQPIPLWLVTQGAQPVARALDTLPVAAAQATLWGLSHVISMEHPELRCIRVDLDAKADAGVNTTMLFNLLLSGCGREDQLAFRDQALYVRRLVRRAHEKAVLEMPVTFKDDACYLITGGLGGLGLTVAEWMIQHGARHLALMGRHEPSRDARMKLKKLEGMGARVLVVQGDISQPDQLAAVLAKCKADMPALRGVIHAAGALDDGVLVRQTWDRFRNVMAAKVAGTWNLHTQTQAPGVSLDFFILFSSGASLLGSAGQANHAAANAFMDAMAHYRQTFGLPAVSINWGAWADVGAAADLHLDQRKGIATMSPQQGLQALGFALQSGQDPQVAVLPADWDTYFARLKPDQVSSLLSALYAEYRSRTDQAGTAIHGGDAAHVSHLASDESVNEALSSVHLAQQLNGARPDERRDMVAGCIVKEVSVVLRLAPNTMIDEQQGLFEMGLDSLMAVELKSRLQKALGCNIPSTFTFNYPTVAAMTDYFLRELLQRDDKPVAQKPADKNDGTSYEHGSLNEDELAAMLAAKLDLMH